MGGHDFLGEVLAPRAHKTNRFKGKSSSEGAGCSWVRMAGWGLGREFGIVEKSGPFEMMRFTLQTSAEMGLDHFFGVLAQEGQKGYNFLGAAAGSRFFRGVLVDHP